MSYAFPIRVFIIAAVLFASAPFLAFANNDCSFNRTLSLGDEGEDVRCLQVFLNSAGYEVASVGVGSPGRETTTYGSLTEAAVLRWQQAVGVTGANGNFGPGSQAAYNSSASTVVASGNENLDRMVADLQQQLALGLAAEGVAGPVPQVAGVSDSAGVTMATAMDTFKELVTDLSALEEDMDGVTDSDIVSDALNLRLNLYNGLLKLFAGEYAAADRLAEALIEDVDDMSDDLEETVESDLAEEKLEDAWDAYKDADDEVDEAEDNDDSGADDARELLDEARDLLKDADDEFDDEEYDDVLDLVEEAEEHIEEALDEL